MGCRSRLAAALALLTILSACSGLQPTAQIPVSGVSGSDGGSTETIYYDSQGHAHFEN
jgi:ABC-type glycerol-3-phosphate transport system substrate-binding protein